MDNFITKQDILEYIDFELHPIISPDYYDVYCTLHDMVEKCDINKNIINKQKIIDELRTYKFDTIPLSADESEIKGYNNGIDLAISVISEFENKKNHWEFIGDNLFRCKKCGYIADIQWLKEWKQKITDNVLPNFCPNCGERMYEQ